MRQKSKGKKATSWKLIKDIRRKTCKVYSAEEKIRIVLDGLRAELSIAALRRRESLLQMVEGAAVIASISIAKIHSSSN